MDGDVCSQAIITTHSVQEQLLEQVGLVKELDIQPSVKAVVASLRKALHTVGLELKKLGKRRTRKKDESGGTNNEANSS